ncbi:DUF1461 domain-containing protein [Candidatus Woesearchaeota archaeon]|nr:DUF1461 domain-containing protein [Candidatus Woesearchaeota archaeon]
MHGKRIIKRCIFIFLIVSFPVLLILSATINTINNKSFILNEFEKHSIAVENKEKIVSQILNYFKNDKRDLDVYGFDLNEISHMRDVKMVILKTRYFFYVLLAVNILLLFFSYLYYAEYKKEKTRIILKRFLNYLFYGSISTMALILLLFLSTFINFEFLFSLFHKTFFPQGNYAFASGLLITLFPEEFWVDALVRIISISFIVSLAVFLAVSLLNLFGRSKF